MKADNETCVQRAIIELHYQSSEKHKGDKLMAGTVMKGEISPDDVRQYRDYLSSRLGRIASMMDILLEAHDDWAVTGRVTGRKGFVQMETQSFDFKDIIRLLNEHGFSEDEYIIKLDYTRKWGVL
jgi:hypothetical protein